MKDFFWKAKSEYADDLSMNDLSPNQKMWVLKKDDIVKQYGISKSFAKNFMRDDYRITWDDTQKCIAWMLDHFDKETERREVQDTLIKILMADVGKISLTASGNRSGRI